MVGLLPGHDLTAKDEYSIRRSAMKRQSGRTRATSESSPTLSSGLCEARSSQRRDTLRLCQYQIELALTAFAKLYAHTATLPITAAAAHLW